LNKNLKHDESKGRIANFGLGQYESDNPSDKPRKLKLPKIRSMTLNTSYKFVDKNNSI
jgi:hypothetical protein